jgi:23S rRNA (cytosine1962-C5)-methyltransferase
MTPRVILQPRRARPFFGRHPWVFAGAIARVEGDPADGSEVDLVTHTGEFVAHGLYNGQSNIRVRLYSWAENETLDPSFFRRKIESALRLRTLLGLMAPEGACRLVNSEGDGLSGLVVDRYAGWLVVQFTSLALFLRREMIVDHLRELLTPAGVYLRTERGIGKLEGLQTEDGPLVGTLPTEPLEIVEPPLGYRVNLAEGQKTGFYLDQRDNRVAVSRFAPGRRVLDCFTYSGGFALQAARAGAAAVIGVDQSEPALELARANATLNGLTNVTFQRAEVVPDLMERVERQEKFGLVVLDPPKFARNRNAVEEALRGYRRLQALALRLLEPEGILAMCCCSGLISQAMLEELLAELAAEEKREVQILERRGPAGDHPVSVACLESHYLKCLILRVV